MYKIFAKCRISIGNLHRTVCMTTNTNSATCDQRKTTFFLYHMPLFHSCTVPDIAIVATGGPPLGRLRPQVDDDWRVHSPRAYGWPNERNSSCALDSFCLLSSANSAHARSHSLQRANERASSHWREGERELFPHIHTHTHCVAVIPAGATSPPGVGLFFSFSPFSILFSTFLRDVGR